MTTATDENAVVGAKLYETYRAYLENENDLLNHRTTWLLVFQGFLFATLGALGQWQRAKEEPYLLFSEHHRLVDILAAVGGSVALVAGVSIFAAQLAIHTLRKQWEGLLHDDALSNNTKWKTCLPGITGGGSPTAATLGMAAPVAIPIIVLTAWLSVAWMAHAAAASASPSTSKAKPQPLTRKELIEQVSGSLETTDELQRELQERFAVKVQIVPAPTPSKRKDTRTVQTKNPDGSVRR